jgi:hypothetical protein
VRTSVAACVLGAVCALVGGFLVGVWCLGLVLIAEGGLVVVWGVLREYGGEAVARPRVPGEPVPLAEVLERARAS